MDEFIVDGQSERLIALAGKFLEAVKTELSIQGVDYGSRAPEGFVEADCAVHALMRAITDQHEGRGEVASAAFCNALVAILSFQEPREFDSLLAMMAREAR